MNNLTKYIICLISLIPIEFVCLIVDYKKGISLFIYTSSGYIYRYWPIHQKL